MRARRHDLILQTPGTEANPPRAPLPIASHSGAAVIAASEPPPPLSDATGARHIAAALRAALTRPPAPASPPGRPRERPAGHSGGSRRGVTHGGASPPPPRPGRPGAAQRTRSAQRAMARSRAAVRLLLLFLMCGSAAAGYVGPGWAAGLPGEHRPRPGVCERTARNASRWLDACRCLG